MSKTKVAVLFGGMSTEHEVSRISAAAVIENYDKERYDVRPVGLTKGGDWLPYDGPIENIKDGSCEAIAKNALAEAGTPVREGGFDMAPGLAAVRECDVVFPVIHGLNCEDGTVQGVLELLGKPYVGCNVLASAVGMDKVYTKIVAASIGVPQARHIVVHRDVLLSDNNAYTDEIEEKCGFPCFAKPANSGSSVGVIKVRTKEELVPALLEVQRYDRKVVVEGAVHGREIECAVLGNRHPKAAEPGEIKPSAEFYDYEDKYKSGTSVTEIPANIPAEARAKIKDFAVRIFVALDCSGLSRVDFFYDDKTGDIVFNEINTIPGFTSISMYSKLWAAEGLPFRELITELTELAFARKEENRREVLQ